MALAKKCDICGAFYTPYDFLLLNIDEYGKYFANGVIYCCPDCMASVLSFVDILKKGGTIDGIPF